MFSVEFYRRENGASPVEEFLNSLPVKHRVKVLDGLALLEEFGNQLREPYSKALGDGLFELRVKFSSDIMRAFYFFVIGGRIVVTNGIVKKSEKTPRGDLELARKYKADYERRYLHE